MTKKSPLRIGIDARMYSAAFTGIGRYVFELTQRLFKRSENEAIEWTLFMNEPEFNAFSPPNDWVKKVLVNAKHYSWAEQVRFLKILNREKLDLMHFTHFNAPLFYRRPSVVTIHDLTLSFYPGKKMRSPIHRLAYHLVLNSVVRHARGIITVSKHTRKDLVHLIKVPESKIQVIYEAAGEEFRVLNDKKLIENTLKHLRIDRDFILYTGVWRDHKNLVRLIQAFATLCEKPTFDGLLVITGREDPFYPEVKATIQKLGLEKRVVLTGLVSERDLVVLYNAARFYVLPSLYEGFGLSPLEAMACGTPVAASNTSCIPEVCGEKNALFFDPYKIEDMARVLSSLWEDSSLRGTLLEQGFQRIRDFSWDKMAEETFEFYKKSLGHSRIQLGSEISLPGVKFFRILWADFNSLDKGQVRGFAKNFEKSQPRCGARTF
ncbi:MAG: glycosyltransferase family 1 protein [Candidatus Gracilibacteria bacterium]